MKSYTYRRLNFPPELKVDLDNLVMNLENTGRAFSLNPRATQTLSRELRVPKQKGDIIFAKDKRTQKTVIVVNPNKKLVRNKVHTIKFYPKY